MPTSPKMRKRCRRASAPKRTSMLISRSSKLPCAKPRNGLNLKKRQSCGIKSESYAARTFFLMRRLPQRLHREWKAQENVTWFPPYCMVSKKHAKIFRLEHWLSYTDETERISCTRYSCGRPRRSALRLRHGGYCRHNAPVDHHIYAE